jgi:uncharacterized protein (DUF1800 family)
MRHRHVRRLLPLGLGLALAAGPVRATFDARLEGRDPAAAAEASAIRVTRAEASRFLAQATLGASWEEIDRTAGIGFEAWLDEQFARPVGLHRPAIESRLRAGLEVSAEHRRWAWWEQVLDGPDPLRQRVALALSEHFVVSDELAQVADSPAGLAAYYDMLLGHAFGNYRDLLLDVTLHPIMGVYLSHLRNERSRGGRFPDENYAREIMQLFSIGLFELRQDGSLVTDGSGRPIPTYDNDDITELAKVFTGLSFASPDHDFQEGEPVWTSPMRMYQAFHEPGPKNLLRGKFVPPGQPGMRDVEDAIDNLFEHPNVGPFVARRLIQRLVTSNPSSAYIARVAAAFADDGRGTRGDMRAVIRAILLDPEARARPAAGDIGGGMLRESFLRRVHLARAFDAANLAFTWPISDGSAPGDFAQRPLSSPTVFNFFLPDFRPQGVIADAGLVAPEFQILTTVTAISSADALQTQIERTMNSDPDDALEVRLDLRDEIAIAWDVRALLDRLDLILMHGSMSTAMRQVLVRALERLDDPGERVKMAVHLISISPEYCVLR